MVRVVGRQQAVAKQRDQVPEVRFAPHEVGGVGDGYVVVGGRPKHEHDVAVQDPQREDGPIALIGVQQQGQRLLDEALGACDREGGIAGRVGHRGGPLVGEVLDEDPERVFVAQAAEAQGRAWPKRRGPASGLAGRPAWRLASGGMGWRAWRAGLDFCRVFGGEVELFVVRNGGAPRVRAAFLIRPTLVTGRAARVGHPSASVPPQAGAPGGSPAGDAALRYSALRTIVGPVHQARGRSSVG